MRDSGIFPGLPRCNWVWTSWWPEEICETKGKCLRSGGDAKDGIR